MCRFTRNQGLASCLLHLADTLSQSQAFLGIALELGDIGASLGLARLERIEQFFDIADQAATLGLRLGLALLCGVLQPGACLVQFFLRLAALLLEFRQQLLGLDQRLGAGVLEVLDEAMGQLMQKMQRSDDGFLRRWHDGPPGG